MIKTTRYQCQFLIGKVQHKYQLFASEQEYLEYIA